VREPGDDVTEQTGPRGYVEPTFGQRVVARLIDAVILVPPIALLSLVLGGVVLSVLAVVLVAVYEIGFVARSGRTPGKMVMNTRVVDTCIGDMPTRRQATRRWLALAAGSIITVMVPVLAGLEVLYLVVVLAPVMLPPLHRGHHDRAAGTIVTADSRPVTG
jgi:uncharacterized RDD family membrane protein YckC